MPELTAEQKKWLFGPIEFIKGVGPARAPLLQRLGIQRPVDLLFYFPRAYQDLTQLRTVNQLEEGFTQTVAVTLHEAQLNHAHYRRLTILKCFATDQDGNPLPVTWFNMHWLYEQLAPGRRCFLIGKPTRDKNGSWQMTNPKIIWRAAEEVHDETSENVSEADKEVLPPYLPIYPLTEGLKSYHLQRIIRPLLGTLPSLLDDIFPEEYRKAHHLDSLERAITDIHFPPDRDALYEAKRRFIYQEFLLFQIALGLRRRQHIADCQSEPLPCSPALKAKIHRLFPYELTNAQKRVIQEISDDLGKTTPMNRLLQGDVGSGKTYVAAAAILQVLAHHKQAVLMAPTEILARQHLRSFTRLLENTQIKIVGMFGAQKPTERAEALRAIADGSANLIIGTQAIIASEISFHALGLVVIDEQHKFGVMQRAKLKTGSGFDPHYLVMTATPIPRSVTMTLFGDLDVSVIDELPPGRRPVKTYIVTPDKTEAWWNFFRRKIQEGRQGYIVVPRVSDKKSDEKSSAGQQPLPSLWDPDDPDLALGSERPPQSEEVPDFFQEDSGDEEENSSTLRSVEAYYEELSQTYLKGFRLGKLHGRMSTEEKERVMLDFRSRAIEVLITTTVVEVGVDIPNATLIVIENADCFGLAQLHQLRGRVGRGKFPGHCAVFRTQKPEPKEIVPAGPIILAPGEETPSKGAPPSRKKGKKRGKNKEETESLLENLSPLEAFASTNDGFQLAEKDLELRGPGDLFGTRQHGLCRFRIADLIQDKMILQEARKDAAEILEKDPPMARYSGIRQQVLKKYGVVLNLGDVG